ncbi:MAG: thermonuclease family protein [bacterium JZ-2024 1]
MNWRAKTFRGLKKLLYNLLFFLFLCVECSSSLYQVEWVVDGDTIRLKNGWSIRYLLINTPELGEVFSREATQKNRELTENQWVRLEFDVQKMDAYGRYLAFVFSKNKMVNQVLVDEGLAHLLIIPPNRKYETVLLEAQRKAQKEKKGIWSTEEYSTLLHISSFRANPEGDEREDPNREYVRIVNITSKSLSLKGFQVKDNQGNTYTFGDISLPPGYSVLLYSGVGEDQLDPKEQLRVYWNSPQPIWNNEGDTCSIYDSEGNLITQKVYEP